MTLYQFRCFTCMHVAYQQESPEENMMHCYRCDRDMYFSEIRPPKPINRLKDLLDLLA